MLSQAQAAARTGLDTLTVGDHHSTGPMGYVQNVPMLGRLLAEWSDRQSGCLFLVPLWNPVLMAEQIGTLAAMSTGPFIVQTGLGEGEGQFRAMGVDLGDRAARSKRGSSLPRPCCGARRCPANCSRSGAPTSRLCRQRGPNGGSVRERGRR